MQTQRTSLTKERHVARIRAGPTALDEVDAERVKCFRDPALIRDREVDRLALGSVTQSGVVNFDSTIHFLISQRLRAGSSQ